MPAVQHKTRVLSRILPENVLVARDWRTRVVLVDGWVPAEQPLRLLLNTAMDEVFIV